MGKDWNFECCGKRFFAWTEIGFLRVRMLNEVTTHERPLLLDGNEEEAALRRKAIELADDFLARKTLRSARV